MPPAYGIQAPGDARRHSASQNECFPAGGFSTQPLSQNGWVEEGECGGSGGNVGGTAVVDADAAGGCVVVGATSGGSWTTDLALWIRLGRRAEHTSVGCLDEDPRVTSPLGWTADAERQRDDTDAETKRDSQEIGPPERCSGSYRVRCVSADNFA